MRTNKRIFPRIHPRLFRREDDLAGFGLVDSGALLSFHAAWADAAGVNQTLLVGTGPVTTDHDESIYALNSSGVYEAFAADDPVWQYDADGDYLVAQEKATNLVLYSNIYAGTGWTPSGTGTITTDEVGIGGIPNSATKIFDTDSAGYYNILNSRVISDSSDPVTGRVAIKKDTNTTRFPEVEFRVASGTAQYVRVGLNTETGEAVAIRGTVGITRFEVVSVGDWWYLYGEVINNGSGNTSCRQLIHPALGTVIGVADQTAVGFIIAGNSEIYDGLTIEQVKSIGPIITTIAAASTSAFDNEYPAANHSNTEGPYYLEFENTGDDVVLMSAGTDEFLKITSNQLILDDGTTQIQAACAAGEHKAGIAFDADTNKMNLNLDGTWADLTDSTAYDGTLGSGVLTLGETERNVKRWNETDYTKQKAKIEALRTTEPLTMDGENITFDDNNTHFYI